MRVSEESGSVSLLVVRAQGNIGTVTVEWRTSDGTAKSSGKVPPDYVVNKKLTLNYILFVLLISILYAVRSKDRGKLFYPVCLFVCLL